ncbi:hypothetical protein M407DRAFT_210579 [Tulasnella calospora MUT 4182]|uniref:Uncharacterized protein n=1 Tax=Tulasnella calospora MUT 4182 TaxID=1051891 RepID=A0A0C3QHW9_9AGAM|nr:hypothetical protein M407DRAFT_210579 [Tulasnella calospora MUT 4182]
MSHKKAKRFSYLITFSTFPSCSHSLPHWHQTVIAPPKDLHIRLSGRHRLRPYSDPVLLSLIFAPLTCRDYHGSFDSRSFGIGVIIATRSVVIYAPFSAHTSLMSKRPPTTHRLGPHDQPSLYDFDYEGEPPKAATAPSGAAESASTPASTTPSGQAVQPSGTASSSKLPGNPALYFRMKTNFGRALAMMPSDELRRILDEAQAESLKPFEER